MTQGSPQFEIEDVLASIRRLVTEDRQAAVAAPPRPGAPPAPGPAAVAAPPPVTPSPVAPSPVAAPRPETLAQPLVLESDNRIAQDRAATAPLVFDTQAGGNSAGADSAALEATLDAIEAAMAQIDADEPGFDEADLDEASLDQDWSRAEVAVELSFDEDTPELTPPSPEAALPEPLAPKPAVEAEPSLSGIRQAGVRPDLAPETGARALVYLAHELEDADEPTAIDWDEKPQTLEWSAPGAPEGTEEPVQAIPSAPAAEQTAPLPPGASTGGRRLHLLAGTGAALTVTETPEDMADDLAGDLAGDLAEDHDGDLAGTLADDPTAEAAMDMGDGLPEGEAARDEDLGIALADDFDDAIAQDAAEAAPGDQSLDQAKPQSEPEPAPAAAEAALPPEATTEALGQDQTDTRTEALRDIAPAAAAPALDEAALRDTVADLIRQELQGVLGERITQNLRKLIQREIQRALAARDLE